MPSLNIAATVPVTEAEGPGRRFAVWVQGCPLRCPGCCNPDYLEFRPARSVLTSDLMTEIMAVRDRIEGVTLVGGEPFSQAAALAVLAASCQEAGLSVMTFSGWTREELADPAHPDAGARAALLAQTDILVAGPYQAAKHSRARRWIGSDNQTLHFLTARSAAMAADWPRGGNTIELRLSGGEFTINGFPHRDITRLHRAGTPAS